MKQKLLWMPEGIDTGATHKRCLAKYKGEVPDRLWVLPEYRTKENKPVLPYNPVHHRNAFLEDKMHDWNIQGEFLKYHGVLATEGSVWLLLEFKETKDEQLP
jgi:hypothetical protein